MYFVYRMQCLHLRNVHKNHSIGLILATTVNSKLTIINVRKRHQAITYIT